MFDFEIDGFLIKKHGVELNAKEIKARRRFSIKDINKIKKDINKIKLDQVELDEVDENRRIAQRFCLVYEIMDRYRNFIVTRNDIGLKIKLSHYQLVFKKLYMAFKELLIYTDETKRYFIDYHFHKLKNYINCCRNSIFNYVMFYTDLLGGKFNVEDEKKEGRFDAMSLMEDELKKLKGDVYG